MFISTWDWYNVRKKDENPLGPLVLSGTGTGVSRWTGRMSGEEVNVKPLLTLRFNPSWSLGGTFLHKVPVGHLSGIMTVTYHRTCVGLQNDNRKVHIFPCKRREGQGVSSFLSTRLCPSYKILLHVTHPHPTPPHHQLVYQTTMDAGCPNLG